MNEGSSRLDQAFEEIRVTGARFQPKLLENIVRFIITLLVPAPEKRAIKWMSCDIGLGWIDIFVTQLRYESRNPLAFVHERFNLPLAQMMSKRARITFPGSPESFRGHDSIDIPADGARTSAGSRCHYQPENFRSRSEE